MILLILAKIKFLLFEYILKIMMKKQKLKDLLNIY